MQQVTTPRIKAMNYIPGCFYAWNREAGEFFTNPSEVTGVDIRKRAQAAAKIRGGMLYRYENMVQAWWGEFMTETWVVPTAADAEQGFARIVASCTRDITRVARTQTLRQHIVRHNRKVRATKRKVYKAA
jgi:hypothetical protein